MGFFESRSTKEKKSHFKNLVLMAFADGRFDDGEQKFLGSIGARMGLSPTEVSDVLSKPEKIKLQVPSDQTEKISQMVDLVGMMMVDALKKGLSSESAVNDLNRILDSSQPRRSSSSPPRAAAGSAPRSRRRRVRPRRVRAAASPSAWAAISWPKV